MATVCLLVLVASTQIFYLTAILPQVLPPLGVPPDDTLEVGGLVIFVTGLAAALGSVLAPRLGELAGDRRAIVWFLGASSLLLAAQAAAPELWTFGILRFLQVLCIAPIVPAHLHSSAIIRLPKWPDRSGERAWQTNGWQTNGGLRQRNRDMEIPASRRLPDLANCCSESPSHRNAPELVVHLARLTATLPVTL